MAKREKKHKGLPVAGYQPQSDGKVWLVNDNKLIEERLLRRLDDLRSSYTEQTNSTERVHTYDQRWLAIARTHFEQGFMAMNRAIFQPARISLPEDEPKTE